MPLPAQKFWRLPDDELNRMLGLVREAGRAELKFIVPEPWHEATYTALGANRADARADRVYFLDTPDLALRDHGVVVRVRCIGDRPDDSVVKLRPVVPGSLPATLLQSVDFAVEVDLMPGNFVCSAALKSRLGHDDVSRTIGDGHPLRTLFSRRQLALFASRVPAHIDIDELSILGPVEVRRSRLRPKGLGHSLVIQQWRYPDGSRLLEVSTRCAAADVLRVAARTTTFLDRHDVAVTGPQQSKTDTTLSFFTRQ
jgi:hypothetical protein